MDASCNLILKLLQSQATLTSDELPLNTSEIFPCIQRLHSLKMIEYDCQESINYIPTNEGATIKENGSPEYQIFSSIGTGMSKQNISKIQNVGLAHALKNGWIKKKDDTFVKSVDKVTDNVQILLSKLSIEGSDIIDLNDIKYLQKRKLIELKKTKIYVIKKGDCYKQEMKVYATDLTTDFIVSGAFKNYEFKPYNFKTTGKIPEHGNFHPLMKVREEFRNIFLYLGFTEMRTDRYVESSFWNFDALFQPQHHPSRDAHDTFFIDGEIGIDCDDAYIQKVKNVHQNGGYGSIGHKNKWEIAEARKGVLRTHTTAISTRYLFKIANILKNRINTGSVFNDLLNIQKQECYKFFSIDKVFRNESVDATHLAEFHQIEGVIVGKDLTLGELMGILEDFYFKLGMSDIRFKPAFNPYTEPSMEIFAFHKGLNKMIEIGNSGIFRPEMLKPMGFENDIVVFGFGLSLERPTMIKYGISNIRELVGHKVDFDFIRNCEVCYF